MVRATYPLVVNLILEQDNKVLMLYRKHTPIYNNMYGLPTGKVEFGESLKGNLIREAKEELGIDLDPSDLEFVLTMWASYVYEGKHIEDVGFVFKATKFKGEIVNAEPHKHDHLKWFSFDNLPQDIQPHTGAVLKAYMLGQSYVEYIEHS